jgi:hypothetical protein
MTSRDLRDRARATLAREVGYVVKPHRSRLRIALAFPNTYFVGMSNLGLQTTYRLFNAQDDVVCERVFLPPKQELAAQMASGVKLVTLESQTPVADFDVFAFSVSFEWDYTNVVSMLRLAGLPIRAEERSARHPLVVLGGAVTFVNPEPLALFADIVAAGEGTRGAVRTSTIGSRSNGVSTCRRATTRSTRPTGRSRVWRCALAWRRRRWCGRPR